MEQITSETRGNKTDFSCGCVFEVIGKNFIYVPCSPECEVYLYAMEQTKLQGNIISYQVSMEGIK